MKRIITLVFIFVFTLGLAACSNAESDIIHKTYMGEITSIDLNEEVLTVLDENTKEEITFAIALLMPDSRGVEPYVETLSVGDRVTVEAKYTVDCEEPYPAVYLSAASK